MCRVSSRLYRFRAECDEDISLFISSIPKLDGFSEFPDGEVEFHSPHTLDELWALARSLPDCHVILQTLEYAHEYTGNRVYERK